MNFKGKKVAILGYGVEGKALAKWLLKQKAQVTICDQNPALKLENKNLKSRLGKTYLKNLTDFAIVFRSPGISFQTREIQQAWKAGIEISSATKLFFDNCQGQIIGVTGTKGKGTAATLIYAMLKESGKRVWLGGNIGKPVIEFIDEVQRGDWVVLELSSFQLQDLEKSPHIAVVLDIKEDHMDYHRSFSQYVESKKNVVRFQTKNDFAVVGADYLTSFEFGAQTQAQVYFFSRTKSVAQGCYVSWSKIFGGGGWVGEIMLKTGREKISVAKTYDIQLRGLHNLENICAASLAAYLAGAKASAISQVVTGFVGLPHRLEKIGQKNGILFFNDSASTNPNTTAAAIAAFSEPLILILGGSDKKANFNQLAQKICQPVRLRSGLRLRGSDSRRLTLSRESKCQSNVKAVILMGKMASEIKNAILNNKGQKPTIISHIKNMKQAVEKAYKLAKSGDVILLSPACASFDMFKDYIDRGNQFKQEVRAIMSQK